MLRRLSSQIATVTAVRCTLRVHMHLRFVGVHMRISSSCWVGVEVEVKSILARQLYWLAVQVEVKLCLQDSCTELEWR